MKRTFTFNSKPQILSTFSVAGPKESEGSIGEYIDLRLENDMFGEDTFEKAESKMLYTAIDNAIKGSNYEEVDTLISGDLLNQIISSSFAARSFNSGYLGIYSACATFTEALTVSAMLIDGNYLDVVACGASSHFSSAERQYRYPLELGCTRPPLSQWTVTGAGACVVGRENSGVAITQATIGKIVDFGVTDVNNMGAAMAPAACDTILTHLKNTNTTQNDYDLIITGDLGAFGSRIMKDLAWEKGFDIEKQHVDCGELIYHINEKEYQGGSGAGCSAVTFTSYFYNKLKAGKLKKILLVATGALLSSVSSGQGESIPGIAHAVTIERV